jgi:Mannosyltransferase (PIG-V)
MSAIRRLDIGPRALAWHSLWASRLIVVGAGVAAGLGIGRKPGTRAFDPAGLTEPFGHLGNVIAAPFARWDSVWYLAIAGGGYAHQPARTAFFPLYPVVLHGLGVVVGSDLIAGVIISLAAFAVALLLLHRLVTFELDDRVAATTVVLLAFWPMSFFFSAVYSESLFLALSIAAVLGARLGRWGLAGVLGGLAAASRNSGVLLIVPIVLLFLYGPRADREPFPTQVGWRARLRPRYPITRELAWTLLIPLGLAVYLGWLALSTGDGLVPFHVQQLWDRHFAGPFGGVWSGAVAAWQGLRQLLHGSPPPLYIPGLSQPSGATAVARQNVILFAFLAFGLIAAIGALRRLPVAYGAYALISLALPLSYPVGVYPLASLPRYEVVLFPLFMWAAIWVSRPRVVWPAIALLALLLGFFTAQFATWRFVA